MRSILLIFTCGLGLCGAGDYSLFDEELYHSALDEQLCALQLQTLETFGFYDSSYRIPQGLVRGNMKNLGNFHQCLAINQVYRGTNVQGKYCLIHAPITSFTLRIPLLGGVSDLDNLTWTELAVNDDMLLADFDLRMPGPDLRFQKNSTILVMDPVKLQLGLCIPKTCTVEAVLRPYVEHPLIRFNYSEEFCRLPGDQPYLAADYTGVAVFALLGLMTVISTAYELHYVFILKKDPAKASELLRACSLYSNTNRLFTFKDTARPLDCLDGIRAISILWIVIFHTQSFIVIRNSINKLDIHRAIRKYNYLLWVFSGGIAVDSFFVLSGLLLVYSAASKMKQLTWRNLPQFYFNRWMRLFPLLAVTVLLQSSVFFRFVDGPLEVDVMNQVKQCRSHWWSALLHVQNIINPNALCMDHTWYLSVDMQLYIVSPLVLYWVLRSPRAAWSALTTVIIASLAATLAFCFCYNFPKPRLGEELPLEYKILYYNNTVTRSPPFFIGMLFGYILHVYKNEKLQITKLSVFLYYSIALVLSSMAIIGQVTLGFDDQIFINLHNALFRSCWAVALCWLILACAHGYGGPVNWFLTLKHWRFVARISYAMYLLSFMIQFTFASLGIQYYFDTQTLMSKFAADLLYTLVLAVVASVLVEAPVTTLYNLLLNSIRKFMLTASDRTKQRHNEKQTTEMVLKY